MKKNILILSLILVVIWFGSILINLERYHYANQVNFCVKQNVDYIGDQKAYSERENCLEKAEPRTFWAWDLYYALF